MPSRPAARRAPTTRLVRLARLALLPVLVLATGLPGALPASAAEPVLPFVAEIHYDNSGIDAGEFVEVQVPPGASTVDWSIALYNGSGGARYDLDPLPEVTVAAGDPAAAVVVDYPSNGIQNGAPDGIALLDATGAVVEFLSYEGSFDATSNEALGRRSTDIGVSESGLQVDMTLSKRRDPATATYSWQSEAAGSRGSLNPPLAPPAADEPCQRTQTVEIGAVQGSGFSTPMAGQEVTVRGLVVGDLPEIGGFHLQDPDGDPTTSDGIFVASGAPVDLGQTVAVTGKPQEVFGQTQIAAGNTAQVCGDVPVGPLPAAAPLDLPAGADVRERLEGMLVAPADTLTVSEVFALTRFGELTLSEGGLLVQPTELARPGPAAQAIAAENTLRRIVLDDGRNASLSATNRPYLSATTPVRVGDELAFTSPTVLGYGFGQWRLQPADGTAQGTFAPQNTRSTGPGEVGGDIQVAAFNVLNYFLTFQSPGRGARSAADFAKQANKIVPAIEALDAEVVALMEIEDTASTGYGDGSPDQAIADLVGRLNVAAGYDKWSYSPLPEELLSVSRDVIRNGIIYQNDVVQAVGDPVGLVDESVWSNAREPIAQTFAKDGDRFTVIANHLKSKSPGSPSGDNLDTGDGQGAWNGDRTRQAASLAAFAEEQRARSGDEDVLIMGDLNAYSQEDPIEVLRGAGFTDLGSELDPGRYSYVFSSLSGSLDHAMSTAALTAKVTGVAHWNINAVESFAYQYNGDPALYAPDPFRSSDHDPVVLGIDLEERCAGLLPTIRGTGGDDVLTGTRERDVIMGLGGDDVISASNAQDVVCGGAGADALSGDNGEDLLLGGFGDDTVLGGSGDDHLVGGPGADVLDGGRGEDTVDQEGAES